MPADCSVRRANVALAALGLVLAGAMAFGLTLPRPAPGQFGIGYGLALDQFVALACAQGAVYALAVWLALRSGTRNLGLVLGIAILLRLIVLFAPPFLSNDMYRYIWDGWVQGAGINPYRYIPDDPHLAFLRDPAVFPNINRADYAHTIYPPVAQMIFLTADAVAKILHLPPVLGMKLFLLLLEAIGIWAILRLLGLAGQNRTRILIYAWNPVPVWEFASSGHVDAIVICFVALALLAAAAGRIGWSLAALAGATLAKFLPVLLLPALWRRWDFRALGIFAGLLLLAYLPYLDVGAGVFGFLGGYGQQEGIASGAGIFLLGAIGFLLPVTALGAKIYLAAVALLLAALGGYIALASHPPAERAPRTRWIASRAMLLGAASMIALSPHYPWYYPWLLLPACAAPRPSVLWLVTASPLLYLNPTHMNPFWPAFVYGPCLVLALCEFRRRPATFRAARARLLERTEP